MLSYGATLKVPPPRRALQKGLRPAPGWPAPQVAAEGRARLQGTPSAGGGAAWAAGIASSGAGGGKGGVGP